MTYINGQHPIVYDWEFIAKECVVVVRKIKKAKGKSPRKVSKKAAKKSKQSRATKSPDKPSYKTDRKPATIAVVPASAPPILGTRQDSPIVGIELSNISGETTIGDLIVVFPRTRHVLMKHGLRFDVEEAGYIYMTLNVFSALHGLGVRNLVDELIASSKEVPTPPLPQPTSQIPSQPPSA